MNAEQQILQAAAEILARGHALKKNPWPQNDLVEVYRSSILTHALHRRDRQKSLGVMVGDWGNLVVHDFGEGKTWPLGVYLSKVARLPLLARRAEEQLGRDLLWPPEKENRRLTTNTVPTPREVSYRAEDLVRRWDTIQKEKQRLYGDDWGYLEERGFSRELAQELGLFPLKGERGLVIPVKRLPSDILPVNYQIRPADPQGKGKYRLALDKNPWGLCVTAGDIRGAKQVHIVEGSLDAYSLYALLGCPQDVACVSFLGASADPTTEQLEEIKNTGAEIIIWGDPDRAGMLFQARISEMLIRFGIPKEQIKVAPKDRGYRDLNTILARDPKGPQIIRAAAASAKPLTNRRASRPDTILALIRGDGGKYGSYRLLAQNLAVGFTRFSGSARYPEAYSEAGILKRKIGEVAWEVVRELRAEGIFRGNRAGAGVLKEVAERLLHHNFMSKKLGVRRGLEMLVALESPNADEKIAALRERMQAHARRNGGRATELLELLFSGKTPLPEEAEKLVKGWLKERLVLALERELAKLNIGDTPARDLFSGLGEVREKVELLVFSFKRQREAFARSRAYKALLETGGYAYNTS